MSIAKILEDVSSSIEEVASTSQEVADSNPSTLDTMISSAVNWLTEHGLKLVIGIIALIIFCWIVNLFKKLLLKRLLKKGTLQGNWNWIKTFRRSCILWLCRNRYSWRRCGY